MLRGGNEGRSQISRDRALRREAFRADRQKVWRSRVYLVVSSLSCRNLGIAAAQAFRLLKDDRQLLLYHQSLFL